jgi:protein tyrosine phosphatase (PTP) superfamily phosphohydrolase (DUF442 family)
MLRLLLCLTAVAALATACSAPSPDQALANLPNVSFPAPHRVAAGALQAGDLPALQAAGVREVINLRAASETPDFDEAAAVQGAGIDYRHLLIRGPQDLTRGNVLAFDKLLGDAGDGLTVVHCASSNRVGAMIALRAALVDGASTDAALAEGRRWGLKSLEPQVRERLAAWSSGAGGVAPAASSAR